MAISAWGDIERSEWQRRAGVDDAHTRIAELAELEKFLGSRAHIHAISDSHARRLRAGEHEDPLCNAARDALWT